MFIVAICHIKDRNNIMLTSSLTPEVKANLKEVAKNQGFSEQTTTELYLALVRGNGTMAQFNNPEVGGMGQWLRGGMIMVGDMFNNNLKSRVTALFNELSTIYEQQPLAVEVKETTHHAEDNNDLVNSSTPTIDYIPPQWGQPSASGSQNETRYAYYPQAHRLLVIRNGESWVFDTADHQIGGVQQQNDRGEMTFTSQYGIVSLNRLTVVMKDGKPV
jgi:hypothetical protein